MRPHSSRETRARTAHHSPPQPPPVTSRSWVSLVHQGRATDVPAGGMIGRSSAASLQIRDSRVSEAHAMVSLRGPELKLLALRRWFTVDGERASEAVLEPGQQIGLAPEVSLEVRDVHVADHCLALDGIAGGPLVLTGSVHSLAPGPRGLHAEPGYVADAAARVFSVGDGWALECAGTVTDLAPGVPVAVGPAELQVVALDRSAMQTTMEGFAAPLRIVLRHDTVHLHRDGRPAVALAGIPARIVSEVALLAAPAPWEVAAAEVWHGAPPRHVLRQNWDRNLRTLRRHLRTAGIRADLVRPDGHGNVELFLLPGDQVVDET